MKTTAEKIDVMLAFVNGAKIECMDKDDTAKQFNYVGSPVWDWNGFDYRVMDERTLERKIEDKWPDKEVVMLGAERGVLRIVKNVEGCEYDYPHIFAQSMKGFAGYVYTHDNDLIKSLKPAKNWKGKIIQPVAVLFEGEE